MSLESLFQHILFTEHQAEENRRLMREVRSEAVSCRGQIQKASQQLKEEKLQLDAKVQQFSEKSFLLQLLKTHENALERQCSEIMNQRSMFLQTFEATKKKAEDEEEKFIKEITDFNNKYEITKNRELLMKENIKIEVSDLENQANILQKALISQKIQNLEKDEDHWKCLQLKKELKLYEEDDMESIYEALQTEIEALELTLAQKELQENNV
ncbi:PREDICTED: coiled-coil domain-containing protein 172 [Chrysochloris asiatica]|uniref:Coiled-coil domain-containing protein 172 n=1 Tax=Chrysochloris asiatica TaxID=185453 RepID=A0A9B0T505_CHRAS|nr:PREDICTED: coiled-coil domain-containing protein 172 [Chrysochloris asiatica]